jgi:calcium-dependent protein kinase
LEREENLLSAFYFFDKDGSGYITIDELQQACKEFGLSDVHLDEMIKEIDQDNVSDFKTSANELNSLCLSIR